MTSAACHGRTLVGALALLIGAWHVTGDALAQAVSAAADPPAAAAASAAVAAPAVADTPASPGPPAAVQPATPPQSRIARWLDPATAPFIPIPEIDTAPGSGTTLGLIPTVLQLNERGDIERIVAPDVIHSQYFGWGSRLRIFDYPSEDTQWSVIGGAKERVEREFDGRYASSDTRFQDLGFTVEGIYDRSGIPRFFGIGNNSLYSNQSSYLDNQWLLDVALVRRLTPSWQLGFSERARNVDVLPGVLPTVPSTTTLFPSLPGLGSEHELQQTGSITRDTRDSAIIPQQGGRYLLYSGFVSRALASSVSYTYFGAEARHYWALNADNTLAWHAAARYMPSAAGAPFWALSSLGGDRSVTDEREPLRSSVTDRYMDRNLFASGVELRSRVAGFSAFGTHVSLEVGPFVDTGRVFSAMGADPIAHLHTAGGLAVRGVASPFVVGYVDVGFGEDGAAIFSGINYPF